MILIHPTRLLVSGVSIAMVPRELESLEHETECLQVGCQESESDSEQINLYVGSGASYDFLETCWKHSQTFFKQSSTISSTSEVTAKIPTTGPCRNPICSYVAQSGGFCCVACQKMKQAIRRCGLRNIKTFTESDGFQSDLA